MTLAAGFRGKLPCLLHGCTRTQVAVAVGVRSLLVVPTDLPTAMPGPTCGQGCSKARHIQRSAGSGKQVGQDNAGQLPTLLWSNAVHHRQVVAPVACTAHSAAMATPAGACDTTAKATHTRGQSPQPAPSMCQRPSLGAHPSPFAWFARTDTISSHPVLPRNVILLLFTNRPRGPA